MEKMKKLETKRIIFSVPKEQHRKIKLIAFSLGMTMSQFIVKSIEDFIIKQKKN